MNMLLGRKKRNSRFKVKMYNVKIPPMTTGKTRRVSQTPAKSYQPATYLACDMTSSVQMVVSIAGDVDFGTVDA